MSRREHDTASRPPCPTDFRPASPSAAHAYASLYANRPIVYTYPVVSAIPPPSSILPANGPTSHLATGNTEALALTSGTPAITGLSRTDALHRRREISPPPLRRSQTRAGPQTWTSNPGSTPIAQPQDSPTHNTQPATLPSRTPRASNGATQWNKHDLSKALQGKLADVRKDHSRLVAQVIEATSPAELRIHHGMDLFAKLGDGAVPERTGETMRVKFKQHLKPREDKREEHHNIIPIKTTKERVPKYRFHHVQVSSNVLTPNTMLTFVPHLRDLEGSEETKYNLWLKELEDIDLKSGFKPMNREEKVILAIQTERAATVSLYLDTWLESLNIPNCTKSALIAYMATQESDDNITPQKKTDITRSNREADGNPTGLDSTKAAALFADAFNLAFEDNLPLARKIELRRILALDESVDGVLDPKPVAKDVTVTQQGDEDEMAEARLATYSILGCLICFSHSCDHGEYDIKNLKRNFSVSSVTPLAELLRQRRRRYTVGGNDGVQDALPCRSQCYRLSPPVGQMREAKPWIEDEHVLLRSIFLTTSQSMLQQDPICYAAEILDRECSDVYAKFQALAIQIPEALRPEPPRLKPLSWFDNRKKMLIGDWQDHTITHEHQRREVFEPCSHEGACTPQNCTCVEAGILCEKWCKCTTETCAYKFTGCGCHSAGKCCQSKQREKPCLCVQLNRECDPILCGTCGALERCDPVNARDDHLHETGCQNSELQRGLSRELVLGQSQLDGVGYGLFTAEAIAQDGFVVEYVGELITHDEGVRREARRGDVFDEKSNISYVFTLLENEGIWVDAAIYGNLSRYINHASEHDSTGSNITPRILYANGEYRIKFTAMRNIEAGEELFFNYGENFPNLTKKLLDTKAGQKPEGPWRSGRPAQATSRKGVARKAPKPAPKKMEQKKPIMRRRRRRTIVKEDSDVVDTARRPHASPLNRPVKSK